MRYIREPFLAGLAAVVLSAAAQAETIGIFVKDGVRIEVDHLSSGVCGSLKDKRWRNAVQKTMWGKMPACWAMDGEVVEICPIEQGKLEKRVCMYVSQEYFLTPARLR